MAVLAAAACALLLPLAVHAQSACTSDGVPPPRALVERFLDAGCSACWQQAGEALPRGETALDWIVPSAQGDDAPLSAAARLEGTQRAAALGLALAASDATAVRRTTVEGRGRLRVAHGPAVNRYVGVVMRYAPPRGGVPSGPLTAWLAVVESVAPGTEGTPVARQLVRNTVQQVLARPADEVRVSVALPEGTATHRLSAVGWVQDAQGRVVAGATTRCRPAP